MSYEYDMVGGQENDMLDEAGHALRLTSHLVVCGAVLCVGFYHLVTGTSMHLMSAPVAESLLLGDAKLMKKFPGDRERGRITQGDIHRVRQFAPLQIAAGLLWATTGLACVAALSAMMCTAQGGRGTCPQSGARRRPGTRVICSEFLPHRRHTPSPIGAARLPPITRRAPRLT